VLRIAAELEPVICRCAACAQQKHEHQCAQSFAPPTLVQARHAASFLSGFGDVRRSGSGAFYEKARKSARPEL
jgi:hypothetical protein